MQWLQHRLRMGSGDSQKGAGGAFGAAVALYPVLEGARADAHERGKLILAEPGFLTNRLCIRRRNAMPGQVRALKGGAARGLLFPTENGTAG